MTARLLRLAGRGSWVGWLVCLGLFFRCFHYLRNPSMWHDEAALVLNVLGKDFRALLGPLFFSEAAPPLFPDLPLGFDYIDLRLLDVTAADVAVRRVDAGRIDVHVDTNDDAGNAGDLRIVVYTHLPGLDVGAPRVGNEIWVDA